MPTLPEWATTFHPFTWLHAVSVLLTVGPIVIACLLGRHWLQRGRRDLEDRLAVMWAGVVIGINLWSLIFWSLPAQFDPKESLPLHICDLAGLIAPFVFLRESNENRGRWARSLLFFWGIGLSTQAFVTPTVLEGPAETKYYLFWLIHTSIVGTAVYDFAVRRYRPTVRDLLLAIGVSILYTLAMVMVNHFLDANYAFIGNQLRARPTAVDKLGTWPNRIFIMTAIALGGFCVMWAVVAVIERGSGRRLEHDATRHDGSAR